MTKQPPVLNTCVNKVVKNTFLTPHDCLDVLKRACSYPILGICGLYMLIMGRSSSSRPLIELEMK